MNINISSATSIITDEHFHESIAHGNQSFPFSYYYEDIWFFDFHCIDWHWHHEVEFVTVLSGTAFCLIGDERIELPQGSSIFINSGILHRFEAHESTIIHCFFPICFCTGRQPDLPEIHCPYTAFFSFLSDIFPENSMAEFRHSDSVFPLRTPAICICQ